MEAKCRTDAGEEHCRKTLGLKILSVLYLRFFRPAPTPLRLVRPSKDIKKHEEFLALALLTFAWPVSWQFSQTGTAGNYHNTNQATQNRLEYFSITTFDNYSC